MQLLEKLLALIFPPNSACLVCGSRAGLYGICRKCRAQMAAGRGFLSCPVCGRYRIPEHSADNAGVMCKECLSQLPPFSAARSIGPYTGRLKEAIYLYKYHGCRSMSEILGLMLSEVFLSESLFHESKLLVPVPLSRQKAAARGFNQSELLAIRMGQILKLPVLTCLTRLRDTITQSKLTGKKRRENIRGAFELNRWPGATRITLVDDVITTGATVEECARVLKQAGVEDVTVITLASGIQENINNIYDKGGENRNLSKNKSE